MQIKTQVLLFGYELYTDSENFLFVIQLDLQRRDKGVPFSMNPVGTCPDDF